MAGFDNDIMFANGSDVGVFPNTSSADNSTEFDRSGSGVLAIVNNVSNTASSTATHQVRVEGTSAGDPWYQLSIGTTKSYAIGQDQADTFFRITTADSGTIDPSSGQTLLIFDEGIVGDFRARFPISNMVLASSLAGGEVDSHVLNSDNTMTDSNARINIQVGGDSGGDPYITFTGGAWSSWSMGVANDVSDVLRIFQQNEPSTTSIITQQITVAGEVTFPLTPAFFAYLPSNDSNVTGGGTTYVIGTNVALTEVFDQNSDFNTNGTFTAPVSGRYLLYGAVDASGITASMTNGSIAFNTSNQLIGSTLVNPANVRDSGNLMRFVGSVIADMDAADTAVFQTTISNDADTADLRGAANALTYFGGSLQC